MSYGYGRWTTRHRPARRPRGPRPASCLLVLARVVLTWCFVCVVGGVLVVQYVADRHQPDWTWPEGPAWEPGPPDDAGPLDDGAPDGPGGPAGPNSPDGPDGPDPGPLPESGTQPLRENRLYRAGGLPATDCPAPAFDDVSTQTQRDYSERVFGCLVAAWRPLLDQVAETARRPRVFVFDRSGTSPCGTFHPQEGSTLAFYCPVNATMYVDVRQMAAFSPPEDHVAYALVLAHEYGHHVQNVTGILDAEAALAYALPSRALELSRRTELQASCFAGMFLASVEDSYPVAGRQRRVLEYYAFNSLGDADDAPESERSHGQPESQGRWISVGFAENDAGACNTYVVSARDVD